MLVPFATPEDGLVINIAQIVRLKVIAGDDAAGGGIVEVDFADGETRTFTGKAARHLNLEVHFAINSYRQFQIASQSPIVGADGSTPARIM